MGGYQDGTHREAVADALGAGDDVGLDAEPLVGEELSAAAVAALNLVADEQGAVCLAQLLQALCKLSCSHADAAHALDAFQNDGTYIAFLQFSGPCFQIVQGQIGDVLVGIDGGNDFGIVRSLYGQ